MSRLIRLFSFGLLLTALSLMLLLVLVVENEPTFWQKSQNSQGDLATTKQIIRGTAHNRQGPEKLRTIALTAEDLTAVANFALLRKKLEGYAQASIDGSRLNFVASVKIPVRAADLYLNLKLVADDAEPQALIKQVRVGRLAAPAPVVRSLVAGLSWLTPLGRYRALTEPLIREVRIADGRLRVTLNWDREALTKADTLVTDLGSRERLLVYHNRLAELLAQMGDKRFVSLGSLMQPMFAVALDRSENLGNSPVEENRALILVLGAYVNGRNLLQEIATTAEPPTLVRRGVLLNRRIDTAQHFMGSAVLAISGHRTLADMVGLAKEINDTHSGSGFSFTDLAADRAGSMFGKTAVKEEKAGKVQALMSQAPDESVFMPVIKDLPENLGPVDFVERFKEIDSAEFQTVKRQIEERIAACPLYQ